MKEDGSDLPAHIVKGGPDDGRIVIGEPLPPVTPEIKAAAQQADLVAEKTRAAALKQGLSPEEAEARARQAAGDYLTGRNP